MKNDEIFKRKEKTIETMAEKRRGRLLEDEQRIADLIREEGRISQTMLLKKHNKKYRGWQVSKSRLEALLSGCRGGDGSHVEGIVEKAGIKRSVEDGEVVLTWEDKEAPP